MTELVPLLERGVVVRLPDFDLARDKSSVAGAGGRAGSGGGTLWRALPSPLQFLRVILPVCRLVAPAARTPLLQSTCPKASGHWGPLHPCCVWRADCCTNACQDATCLVHQHASRGRLYVASRVARVLTCTRALRWALRDGPGGGETSSLPNPELRIACTAGKPLP